MTICSTFIQNPITPQILLNIYQPLTHYENNLRQSGCNKKLTYKTTDTNHQKHSKHKRKIIRFNPPFSKNVSTKIGKYFLSLLDLHFSRNHIYSNIFNTKKIKVSYSCMQNIKSVTNNHHMKVLNNTAAVVETRTIALYMENASPQTSFTKHRSPQTSSTINKKFT